MAQDKDFRQRAFAAQVAENLGGPARAVLAYQDLVVEQARELDLAFLSADLEKVSAAAAELNVLIDQLIQTGITAVDPSDSDAEAKVRHDLRTPLNAIIGYSEMVAEELADLSHHTLRGDVEVILAEAGKLLGQIDSIVDFSRSDSPQTPHGAAAQALSIAKDLEATVEVDSQSPGVEPGRILVIDDVASNRELLQRRLSRDGHQTVLAASGAQALERLREDTFDLVLSDILMPDINGIELLSRIKIHQDWRRIPVLMISGLQDTEAVIRCIEAGADDYLVKPLNPVLLRARVNACLEKKRWADREQRYLRRIEVEKERNDALLHAVLPGQVVARLNQGEDVIADWFQSASILFADLVGFTPVAAQMAPAQLVQRLEQIFSAFDGLAKIHHVEKIKTIGDAYMAAAGVPEASGDHADRVVGLACAMVETLQQVDPHDVPFRIRVGIHTGPVIAGLLGRHRFIYDVWGETVNIASRLEGACPPGHVMVSQATHDALTGDWMFDPQGRVDLRGVGGIPAYVVRQSRTA